MRNPKGSSGMSIRILLADNHQIIRGGLRSILEKEFDLEIVAEAKHGRPAISLARQTLPDVAIVDISMPGLKGADAIRQLIAAAPDIKVIALSLYSDKRYATRMLSAGASGYLPKDCAFEELVDAVRAVADNEIYVGSRITDVTTQTTADLYV